MQIAIASGKGGTGKTTVATNLAWVASRHGRSVAYVDCDVEEPNGHIFLKPRIAVREPVTTLIPRVDAERCTLCGQCGEICNYSAIVQLGSKVLVYGELCHSCGGCMLVCPVGAITEHPRELGVVERGRAGAVDFVQGLLHVGQPMSPPVIKAVKATAPDTDVVLIDAPPGTSCPVIEAIRDADLVLLVTEPTPFGLHDLKLAVQTVRLLGLPMGVVINRAEDGESETHRYCDARRVPILLEIPDDRRVAEAYSRGQMASEAVPEFASLFGRLLESVRGMEGARR